VSERTLKKLVVTLLAVTALWIVAGLLSNREGPVLASGEVASFFDGVDQAAVDLARLSGANGTVELERDGGNWTVKGFVSDSAVVDRFWAALAETTVGDLAATNPANHDRMGVSQDSAGRLEIRIEEEGRTILVGKRGPRFGTVYGRLPDDERVYVLEGDLGSHVNRRIEDWRSKRVVSADTGRVVRIEVESEDGSFVVVRGDSTWAFEEGGQADAPAMRGLLSEINDLRASGFLTAGDSLAALPRAGSMMAYSGTGEVLAHVTVGSGEGDRWVRAAGDDVLYRLPSYRVSRLVPSRGQMEPDA
jgi:hypothetical protein